MTAKTFTDWSVIIQIITVTIRFIKQIIRANYKYKGYHHRGTENTEGPVGVTRWVVQGKRPFTRPGHLCLRVSVVGLFSDLNLLWVLNSAKRKKRNPYGCAFFV